MASKLHTYKIEHYDKDSTGSYKSPVIKKGFQSITINKKLGENADTFSVSLPLTDPSDYTLYNNDDRLKIYGKIGDSGFTTMLDGLIQDVQVTGGVNNPILTINGANRLEKLFNAMVSTTGESVKKTADTWVKFIIDRVNENNNLGGTNREILYDSNSIPPIDSSYTISFVKDFTQAFQLIEELSRPENTDGNVYIYYLDEDNKFHFKPRPEVVDTSKTLSNIDQNTYINNFRVQRAVFNLVNYIIMNAGKNSYGSSVLQLGYDDASIIKHGWKTKFISKEEIANSLKTSDIRSKPGNWDEGDTFPNNYPYITAWGDNVSTDVEYNSSLVDEVLRVANNKINALLDKNSGEVPKLRMEIPATLGFQLGELINIKIGQLGWETGEELRLTDLNYTFNKNGWSSNLKLERDPESAE